MTKTKELQVQNEEKRDVASAEQTRPGPVYRPPVDICEDAGGFTVLADLPGVKPENLHVDLREGTLTIRGHCEALHGEKEHPILREFESGTYFRQFALTDAVEQGQIDAKLVNGVLRLRLPKIEAARPRRIRVNST
jgi:HSP20 family molecular chaperone IbpA